MPTQAALYARVSTRDKEQNPETQLLVLRDWAERQGLEPTEYVDHASGKDLNRPAWQALARDWRNGKVDVVVVLRLDRAFRSIVDMHNCFDEWEGRGIRFASITQPIDTATATGKLMVNILAAFAEFEREIASERIREGQARARKEGKKIGRAKIRLSSERAAKAVEIHGGNWADAAAKLKVSESTLRRRVKNLGAKSIVAS
ncbi:recombinase family protein [Candidatus Lucifugimonas marina]|uniref:Resolvase n=1 Tax=Candidatus Lucifugimonas marina TaxID=3038979 RepID=A0AAJ5ZFP6_9CHLR|nr:resolvase [SAR202 cluster bacterium JH702]MDG0870837.1 resolvase [SAR202 cluster bacterium JH639]WFG36445.1 resolvase [SAR202 cluster bacterium JH545]WFG40378.1 resolvase [SAR202 cluster bacterium JH1073]